VQVILPSGAGVSKTLVIGFGNKLRRDDGAGPIAAERIAAAHPGVDCLSLPQLTPELAEVIPQYEQVFFLDASLSVQHVSLREIFPGVERQQSASHTLSPQGILQLAKELFHACPRRAVLVEFPTYDLGFGWELSPQTNEMVELFVKVFPQLASGRTAGTPNQHTPCSTANITPSHNRNGFGGIGESA
jgi:hydrogenase maturation protease